jgi:hypothetical protein
MASPYRVTLRSATVTPESTTARTPSTNIGPFRKGQPGLELNRFVDGRVAEHWFQMDSLTLLQQLGLVVVPGPRLLPRVLAHQLKKLRRKR